MEHTRNQFAVVVHDSSMQFFDRQKPSKAFLAKSLQVKHEAESDHSKTSAQFKRFYLGQRVRLRNLSRSELNNTEGVVIEPECDGRVAISLKKASPELLQQHSDGIENCVQYIHNFDPEKSKNPFAYFTQIIHYAFLRRIQKEKKQLDIKTKIIERTGFDEVMMIDDNLLSGSNSDYNSMKDAIQYRNNR